MLNYFSFLLLGVLFGTVFIPLFGDAYAQYVVSGYKFDDLDGDGMWDSGEIGVPNIEISLNNTDTVFGTQTTDSNGYYEFQVNADGEYMIQELLPHGKIFTTLPFQYFTLDVANPSFEYDFGNRDVRPLPSDMTVPSSTGLHVFDSTGVGVPSQNTSGDLTLTKSPDPQICDPVNRITLELITSDGNVIQVPMQYDGNEWSVTISGPFSNGVASFTAFVDCGSLSPPSFPNPPNGLDGHDLIQRGDLVFIDPSGTVYDGCNNLPEQDVKVTLYRVDDITGDYVIPPSEFHIPATNPLHTDENGDYGWMTASGTYKVVVSKSGYSTAEIDGLVIPPPRLDVDFTLSPKNAQTCASGVPTHPPFQGPTNSCPSCPVAIVVPFIVLAVAIAFSFYSIQKNPNKPQKFLK